MRKLNKAFHWFRKTIPKVIDDILLIIGFSCISKGVFQIYRPAGWIVLGIGLIAFGILLSFAHKQGGDAS